LAERQNPLNIKQQIPINQGMTKKPANKICKQIKLEQNILKNYLKT